MRARSECTLQTAAGGNTGTHEVVGAKRVLELPGFCRCTHARFQHRMSADSACARAGASGRVRAVRFGRRTWSGQQSAIKKSMPDDKLPNSKRKQQPAATWSPVPC